MFVRTFSDMIRAVGNRAKLNLEDVKELNKVKESLNVAQQELNNKPYIWNKKTKNLLHKKYYQEGTITLTSGSVTVTGVGTNFTSDMQWKKIKIPGSNTTFVVSYVASSTSIQIQPAWDKDTTTTTGYFIYQNEHGLFPDLLDIRTIRSPFYPEPLFPKPVLEFKEMEARYMPFLGDPRYYTVDGLSYYRQKTWATFALAVDFFEDDSDTTPAKQKKLCLFPAVTNRDVNLSISYTRVSPDFVEDDQEPICPYEKRMVYVYHALVNSFLTNRDIATKREWEKAYKEAKNVLEGDFEMTDDRLQIKPEVSKRAWVPSDNIYYNGRYR